MFNRHLATVPSNLMRDFEHTCRIINFSSWIREQAYYDFGITVASTSDIDVLSEIVESNYYSNIGEWLREKMRNRLLEMK